MENAPLFRLLRLTERLGSVFAGLGAAVVLAQAGWITYGVVMRYVFHSPDRMVTEATALLLFPVAFAGLAHALSADAYPRVSIFADKLPPRAGAFLATGQPGDCSGRRRLFLRRRHRRGNSRLSFGRGL